MSAVASTPSTPGSASAARSRSSRSVRLFIAVGRGADGQRAARRVVGGDDHQPAVAARSWAGSVRRPPRTLDGPGIAGAQVGDLPRTPRKVAFRH